MNKFDKLYEEVVNKQIDESFGFIFKNQAYRWFIYALEEYLGSKYLDDKVKKRIALKRIYQSMVNKKLKRAQKVSDIIENKFEVKVKPTEIVKTIKNVIENKINLYQLHRKLVDNFSKEFKDEGEYDYYFKRKYRWPWDHR